MAQALAERRACFAASSGNGYVNSGMNLLCRPRVYLWLLVKASIPCLISTACPSDICYFCDL
ncbi:hypothetical protein BZL33_02860 [Escherichia coli]|nr:hypothetical protein BZL33_02860 [Escherichia coli]